jgi:hypothetical protein
MGQLLRGFLLVLICLTIFSTLLVTQLPDAGACKNGECVKPKPPIIPPQPTAGNYTVIEQAQVTGNLSISLGQ